MNFHIIQHRKLSEVLSIPNGLQDLMADIAREVLRYQPNHIECFIADYLESMLLTRELLYVTDRTIDDILNHSMQVEQLVKKLKISLEKATLIVKVTEEEFRKRNLDKIIESEIIYAIIQKCHLTVEQARKISKIIESSWRYFHAQNLNKSNYLRINPQVLNASATKNTLLYHQKHHNCQNKSQGVETQQQQQQTIKGDENWITENFQRRENAAIVIQSWYRSKKRQLSKREKAALTIQIALKGFKERKQLEKKQHESAKIIQKSFRIFKKRNTSKMEEDL